MTSSEIGAGTPQRNISAATTVAWSLLALLLLLDLALIGCHIGLVSGRQVFTSVWSVEADNGYAEKLQYLKWLGACLLLLTLTLKRRAAVYFAWAVVFLYFLVDDATSLHERAGGWLAGALQLERVQRIYLAWFPDFFLRPRDFGELAVAFAAGAAITTLLLLSWPSPAAVRERAVTKRLIAWLGLFALFAVGFDTVHIMTMPVSASATYALGIVEDGGEMICASLLVGGLTLELARG